MDFTFTLNQMAIIAGSILAGMIIGSVLVPRPVRGGVLSVIIGGLIGAAIGAVIALQAFAVSLAAVDWRTITAFFLGALAGVILVKLLFHETRHFRTEGN